MPWQQSRLQRPLHQPEIVGLLRISFVDYRQFIWKDLLEKAC